MMKIAFIAAAAVAVLTTVPVTTPVKAQGIGPGGVTVGPRQHCRTVTTRIERDDGRMVTRRERRCD